MKIGEKTFDLQVSYRSCEFVLVAGLFAGGGGGGCGREGLEGHRCIALARPPLLHILSDSALSSFFLRPSSTFRETLVQLLYALADLLLIPPQHFFRNTIQCFKFSTIFHREYNRKKIKTCQFSSKETVSINIFLFKLKILFPAGSVFTSSLLSPKELLQCNEFVISFNVIAFPFRECL